MWQGACVAGSMVHTRRRLAAMVLLTLLGAALIVALDRHGDRQGPQNALGPGVIGGVAAAQPFNYVPAQRAAYERDAALGLSHVLFAKSPGGVMASARRTAHWRPIVDRVARAHRLDASMLEAIVMLESAGRADARASNDLRSAAGLTQILAETGQNLLGLRIDVKASERLTRGILRGHRVRQREALRRRIDERFDPAKAIEATARYLDFAKGKLGRDDLAVVSYHMGVGNLQQALMAYGKGVVPYAQLYFDSSPLQHAAVLQSHKASAEEVLHPQESTPTFRDPFAVGRARASGALRVIDQTVLAPYGLRMDPSMGALAGRIKQSPRLYRALRPPALAVLQALGAATRAISRSQPLIVTSTVRDEDYQRVLAATDQEATHAYSLHTTGYAFDIARVYRSRAQALAFQWVLDRLAARGMIAWIREPQAIHVTVASR